MSADPNDVAGDLIEATDTEVLDAFRQHIRERVEKGIVLGRAVRDISFSNGVVAVTFDAAHADVDEWAMLETSPFDNWADFVGAAISFNREPDNGVRSRIKRVDTFLSDGRSLGSRTPAELFRAATGQDIDVSGHRDV